jgi:hypothetical protein
MRNATPFLVSLCHAMILSLPLCGMFPGSLNHLKYVSGLNEISVTQASNLVKQADLRGESLMGAIWR